MFATAMFLAVISVIMEMFLVTKNPVIRHFFTRHEIVGMGFSFALSVALGTIFGAAGLIAMMGGVCSTVITTVIYKLHLLNYYDKYEEYKYQVHMGFKPDPRVKIKGTKDLVIRSFRFWFRLFTAPIRFCIWVKKMIGDAASAASRWWAKLASLPQRAKRALH